LVGTYISDYMYNSGSLKTEKQQKTNKQTNKPTENNLQMWITKKNEKKTTEK